ncbi:MAG: hypothetical protein H6819_07345 [Phycisphaerales bacterium]|nr:hypothetical protein [Phycisphaerales bacterium]MCB9857691.1 hypothetical protein [Phycisphaerales bacterium]MCB9864780.1 hypothetical protein [Phycisphaerales bacterium]
MSAVSWGISEYARACGPPPPPPRWGRGTFLFKAAPAVFPVAGAPGPVVVPIPVIVIVSSTTNLVASPTAPQCTPVTTAISLSMVCVPPPPPLPPPGPVVGAVAIATPTPGIYPAVVPIAIPAGPARVCLLTGTATTTWANGATSTGMGDVSICIVDPAPGQPPALGSDPRLDLELLSPDMQAVHPGDQARYTYRVTNNDPSFAVTIDLDVDSEQSGRLSSGSPEPPGSGEGAIGLADPGIGDNFPIVFSDELLPPPDLGNNYLLDDGVQAGSAGAASDSILWMNQFTSFAGETVIEKVSIAFGTGADGRIFSIGVYSDPNGDGDPSDAVLLSRTQRDVIASNEDTGIFNEFVIDPADVGPPGSSFFVGVLMKEASGASPAAFDSSPALGRSWIAEGSDCGLSLDLDIAPSEGLFPAGVNWMVRANGRPFAPIPQWIVLPLDPTATTVPLIERTIRLCPGETRIVNIDTRGWGMCLSGSGCESRMIVTGMFDDGSPALVCSGTSVIVEASLPPDYLCPDGGVFANVLPQGGGLRYQGSMPTHSVDVVNNVLAANAAPQMSPPLTMAQVDSFVLASEGFRGRQVVQLDNGGGSPAAMTGETLIFSVDVEIASVAPGVNAELIGLRVHHASPVVEDTYFFVLTRSRLTGAGIPVNLDTYFDNMIYFSLDGISGSEFHRSALIDQSLIDVQFLSPTVIRATFQAEFPATVGVDCNMDDVVSVGDIPGFVAALLGGGDTCADANSDGATDGLDIQPFVDQLLNGPGSGTPIDELILQVDGSANAWGLPIASLGPVPNDGCLGASIVVTGANLGGNNCAANDPDENEALCQGNSGRDVYYVWTADCTGLATIDTEGSLFAPSNDTVLSVYDDCAGTELACDDDDGTGLLSTLSFACVSGVDYIIRVAGFSANCGDIVLNISCAVAGEGACCLGGGACVDVTGGVPECSSLAGLYLGDGTVCGVDPCPPPGDTCADAIVVGSGTTSLSSVGNLFDDGDPGCTTSGELDIWAVYTVEQNGSLLITTCGTRFDGSNPAALDTILAAYDGICGGLELDCDDDCAGVTDPAQAPCHNEPQAGSATRDSCLCIGNVTVGQVIYIQIQDFSSHTGNITLNITPDGCP